MKCIGADNTPLFYLISKVFTTLEGHLNLIYPALFKGWYDVCTVVVLAIWGPWHGTLLENNVQFIIFAFR